MWKRGAPPTIRAGSGCVLLEMRKGNLLFDSPKGLGGRKWQPTPVICLENPTDRGAWQATVRGVGHDLATKPPPPRG